MSLIYNERTKLLANALDRASTACIVVSLITPAVTGGIEMRWEAVFGISIWLFAALILHLLARHVLGGLKP